MLVNNVAAPIRRPLFLGTLQVNALWFDPALVNEREIQRRILAHWQIGARLYRIAHGYLLYFPTPRWANCAALDGLALCDQAGVLSSAPLTSHERKQALAGSVWLVLGAQAQVLQPQEAQRIDPSIWLDVRHIPLRTPLTPPRAAQPEMILTADPLRDVRKIVGGRVGAASRESQEFLQALQQAEQGKVTQHSSKEKLLQAGAGMLAGLLGKFFAGLTRDTPSMGKTGQTGSGASANEGIPQAAEPSKLGRWLHDMAAKLVNFTKASDLLGMQHARYMNKLLEMFDKGDVLEALRHAIPLSDGNESGDSRQMLSTLQARDSLSISMPGNSRGTLGASDSLMEYLRKKYRQIFERLEREGKIDEAVFVLAELLKAGKEAVDFLERHQRFQQAAELAQTLALAPEIAIRLWLLAGEQERALRLARVHNAYEATLRMLDNAHSAHSALARELRLKWAQEQAARGEWVAAVLTLWPLIADGEYAALLIVQAQQWLAFAQQAGGQLGAQALVYKLALWPETLPECSAEIAEILAAEGGEGAQQRARLGQALVTATKTSAAHKRVMLQLLRHLVPERLAGANALSQEFFQQAMQLADSALLRADMPKLSLQNTPSKALQLVATPLTFAIAERGMLTIHDACKLADGYLLALGESGVVRINQLGKQIAHFPIPAHHLVLASGGGRALALAKRENVLRISQLDLSRRSVADWLSLPCSFWASDYDGALWNVVMHNKLLAIDTSKAQLTVAWQVADLPGKIINFQQTDRQQSLLMHNERELQQWWYALPERRLQARNSSPLPDSDVWQLHFEGGNELCKLYWLQDQQMENSRLLWRFHTNDNYQLDLGNLKSAPQVAINGQFLAVLAHTTNGAHLQIAHLNKGQLLASCHFSHAERASLRWQGAHLLAFDQAGRLFDINVASSEVHSMCLQ